jgi:hypothetical protein
MIRCPPGLQWDQARSPAAVTPDDVRSVSRLIAHTADALRLAEHDAKLVGVPIAAGDGWRGNVHRLAVLPTRKMTLSGLWERTGYRRDQQIARFVKNL